MCLLEMCLLTCYSLMIRADRAIEEGVEALMLKTCSLTTHEFFAFAGLHHHTILTHGDLAHHVKDSTCKFSWGS